MKVWFVLFTVQLCYCVWHVVGKKALMDGMHPIVLAIYRELGACMVMHALATRIDGRPPYKSLRRADWRIFLIMGILSYGNLVGFIMALNYITAFNSALLHPTIPVFAAAIAVMMRVETLTRHKAVGIGFCALGSFVVTAWGVQGDSTEGASNVVLGNIILVIQCFSMAALLVTQKRVLERYPPTTTTAGYYTVATVMTLITTLAWVQDPSAYVIRTSMEWVAVIFGALVGVTYIYCALAWCTQRTSPATTAVSMTMQPPLNALLSVLFMGRTMFSLGEVLGGLLIMGGLVITVWVQLNERSSDSTLLPSSSPEADSPPEGVELTMAPWTDNGEATDEDDLTNLHGGGGLASPALGRSSAGENDTGGGEDEDLSGNISDESSKSQDTLLGNSSSDSPTAEL